MKPVIRATRAVIDLSAIAYNIRAIRQKIGPKVRLMAVVKADGYGHGAVEVARVAVKNGADWLGVAIPEEGKQLREAGIQAPILVFGLIQPEEAYKVVEYGLEQTVCTDRVLKSLDRVASSASTAINVHLKVDTGMGRLGVSPEDVLPVVRKVRKFRNVILKGIFSHFATADASDKTFAMHQLELFNKVLSSLAAEGIDIPMKHIANSAAILDIPQAYYGMVRAGIMVYGLYPSKNVRPDLQLRPAMSLKTKVAAVRTVVKGSSISYGRTFITRSESTKIATLPIGYADGLSRSLSNGGEVVIRGIRAPIVGTVCMDMCMIDVSHIEGVKPGDEVSVFGGVIHTDEVAGKIGTINYEVVCAVSKRVPRVYIAPNEALRNPYP